MAVKVTDVENGSSARSTGIHVLVGQREFGVALLSRGGPERRIEALRVQELLPGDRLLGVGEVEVPRREAVLLAASERTSLPRRQDFKELCVGVPQLRQHELLQLRGLVAILRAPPRPGLPGRPGAQWPVRPRTGRLLIVARKP